MDKPQNKTRKIVIISGLALAFAIILTIVILIIYAWGATRLKEGSWLFIFIPYLLLLTIIPGVLLLVMGLINEKHQILSKKIMTRYFISLISVIVLGTISSLIPIEIKYKQLSTYSRERWLTANGYRRGQMIDSFIKQVNLINQSETDVIYYLGTPDDSQQDVNITRYYYDLGLYHDFLDSTTFIVTFNEIHIVVTANY